MRESLCVDVLDYVDFDLVLRQELAHKTDPLVFSYKRWSKMRTCLIEFLKRFGTPDQTGYGRGGFIRVGDNVEYDGGDFFVGEDWFELGILSVLVLHWNWLSADLLRECKSFVVENSDFIIRIEIASFAVADMFELVVTPSRCYLGIFDKTAIDAWSILQSERYKKIRSVLRKGADAKRIEK
jgi:hypothetical protein